MPTTSPAISTGFLGLGATLAFAERRRGEALERRSIERRPFEAGNWNLMAGASIDTEAAVTEATAAKTARASSPRGMAWAIIAVISFPPGLKTCNKQGPSPCITVDHQRSRGTRCKLSKFASVLLRRGCRGKKQAQSLWAESGSILREAAVQ